MPTEDFSINHTESFIPPESGTMKGRADYHTIFGFLAEMISGLGDILYLSRFLSYLDQDNIVFAGLSPVGMVLGVLIAVGASVGTAKSHFELNKYFENPEKIETEEKALSRKEKVALFLNCIGGGINFSSPIGSGLRKAKYDFGLTLSEADNFAINLSLLTVGSFFALGDSRSCKNAMTHKKMLPNENKKIDKLAAFSAAGRIPGAISYFYFVFIFFKLWGEIVADNTENKNTLFALTTILPAILAGIVALYFTVSTVMCRYKLYDYCANALGINRENNNENKTKLNKKEKVFLPGSLGADTIDIASSLVFNVEILVIFILSAKQNPLTKYEELFGLFFPAILTSLEGAAANYRSIKTAILNGKSLFAPSEAIYSPRSAGSVEIGAHSLV